jgi:hypothetical protein
VRLLTYYTDTHAEMCQRFVVDRATGFDAIAKHYPQRCETGAFKSEGWNECMLDKLDAILSLPNSDEPVVYVDSDVVLLPGFHEYATKMGSIVTEANYVLMSDDVIQLCAGIMVFRMSQRTRWFFEVVARLSPMWNLPDQDVIANLRMQADQSGGRLPVSLACMDPDKVCNWATVCRPTVPQPWQGESFVVPETCVAWHANWTIGVDRKMDMLTKVVEQVEARE